MSDTDPAAGELLDEVTRDWAGCGLLPTLVGLVNEVWRRNVDRAEPRLGDDAQVLGIQSSFNVRNLAVPRLAGLEGVRARVVDNALHVERGGRVLHVNKSPGTALSWDVHGMDWTGSDVKKDGARANSTAYSPTAGTLLEGRPAELLGDLAADPRALRHLHLTWLGTPDGATRAWLGFPRQGDSPWFAVKMVGGLAVSGPGRPETSAGGPTPGFDALREPQVPLSLRRDKGSDTGGGERG